jgi:integrase
MGKTVKHSSPLEYPKTRLRLKPGRQAHFESLRPGFHLGYIRAEHKNEGRWVLRRYLGGGNRYAVTPLGSADDVQEANGTTILAHAQAVEKAMALIEVPGGEKIVKLTVKQAVDKYIAFKRSTGASVQDVVGRGAVHILPVLGDRVVSELTAEQLRRWLAAMAAGPAHKRPKANVPQYREEAEGDEEVRRRRSSANRVLTILKAVLNFAYDEGYVASRDAWSRKLKPFPGVSAARVRFLSVGEAARLVNACDPDFGLLVRAGLETGCRYSELGRLVMSDFAPDHATLTIRKSKSGKARHVILSEDGAAFFREVTAGRSGGELMFRHEDGRPWRKADQARPMRAACERAQIVPRISFHGLRHTWASLAIMSGMPPMVAAQVLGHRDTRQIEHFYGHLSAGYVASTIKRHAPRYGIKPDKKVVPLK